MRVPPGVGMGVHPAGRDQEEFAFTHSDLVSVKTRAQLPGQHIVELEPMYMLCMIAYPSISR
ncbi:hypothetical protein P40081_32190 [Paenibacillus sp. FSL P4-0081]|nr:hypothetical protein P40081_32190 [Paenibacillus sp. FSL P4-0081]